MYYIHIYIYIDVCMYVCHGQNKHCIWGMVTHCPWWESLLNCSLSMESIPFLWSSQVTGPWHICCILANVGKITINHPFGNGLYCSTCLWWFGVWFIVALPTLSIFLSVNSLLYPSNASFFLVVTSHVWLTPMSGIYTLWAVLWRYPNDIPSV